MNLDLRREVPQSAREFKAKREPRVVMTPERRSELLNLQEELAELNAELKRLETAGLKDDSEAIKLRGQIALTTEAMEGQHAEVQGARVSELQEPKGESYATIAMRKERAARDVENLSQLRVAIMESEAEDRDSSLPLAGSAGKEFIARMDAANDALIMGSKLPSADEIEESNPLQGEPDDEGQRLAQVVGGEIVPGKLVPLSREQRLVQKRLKAA